MPVIKIKRKILKHLRDLKVILVKYPTYSEIIAYLITYQKKVPQDLKVQILEKVRNLDLGEKWTKIVVSDEIKALLLKYKFDHELPSLSHVILYLILSYVSGRKRELERKC